MRSCVAGAVVLTLCGCHSGPTAKDISLAKFGGALTLQLNVNARDKFVYEETAENREKSPRGDFEDVERETTELEVLDRSDAGFKFVMTDSASEAESDNDDVARTQKRHMARLMGLHVEGVYDEHGATKSITPVTTDETTESLARDRLECDAGLHGVVLPPGPVHIGDQWASTVTLYHKGGLLAALLSDTDQAPKAQVTYKLVGAQEEDGKDLAVIEWGFQWKADDSSASVPGLTIDSGKSIFTSSSSCHGRARVEIGTGMVYDAECESVDETAFSKTTTKTTVRKKSGR